DSATAILTEWAPKLRQEIAGHLGFDIPNSIELTWDLPYLHSVAAPKEALFGDALATWPGGTFGRCYVAIYSEINVANPAELVDVLSHEMFHCFQFAGYGTQEAEHAAPQWVVEGQAEYVGGDLSGGTSRAERVSWSWYLTWPQQSLFQRAYDAVGFYEHLKETGTDPWTIFRAMWSAPANDVAIFQASGADRESFYDSWASSVMRDPGRGPAWTTDGYPGARPTDHLQPITIGITDGTTIGFSAAFVTNDVRLFNVGADMVHISVEGHGRLSDGSIDTTDVQDVWYCIDGHTCSTQCTPGTGPDIAGGLAPLFALAISGALDGTIATVEAKDIKDVCQTPQPSPTDDEFCIRYRAFLAWAAPYQGDVTQTVAAGVAQRMQDMRPVAPAQLLPDVDLYIKVYGTYAKVPEPYNLPMVGPDAAGIANAFMAMNQYCGITF
ncbi:MAG TPA: basic secretory protein-like protein, partial [Candidatus Limnocylindrales bacterium]